MATSADILIIEDERRLRYFAMELLRLEGLSAAEAADGCVGLDYLEALVAQGDPLPSVILLDMTMPCMTGEQLYAALMEKSWATGFTLVITSAAGERFAMPPAPGFTTLMMHKPYDVNKLLATLKEAAPRLFER